MKRCLFLCQTPYHVLMSIILKYQNGVDADFADIVVCDTFSAARDVYASLKDSNQFGIVYFAAMEKYISPKSMRDKSAKIGYLLNFKAATNEVFPDAPVYDRIYYSVENLFTFNCCSYFELKSPSLEVYRFEEGWSSYTIYNVSATSKKLTDARNKLYGIKSFDEMLKGYYVCEPGIASHSGGNPTMDSENEAARFLENYEGKLLAIDRGVAKSPEVVSAVKKIFDTEQMADAYRGKVVIFEDSYFNFGYEIDDIDIYKDVIGDVGASNVIVRLHPRSRINRFEPFGVKIAPQSTAPWEAIMLTGDVSGSLFIALTSGSVINTRLLLGDCSDSILAYKCLTKKPPLLDASFCRFVDRVEELYSDSNLYVPENREELLNIVEKLWSKA